MTRRKGKLIENVQVVAETGKTARRKRNRLRRRAKKGGPIVQATTRRNVVLNRMFQGRMKGTGNLPSTYGMSDRVPRELASVVNRRRRKVPGLGSAITQIPEYRVRAHQFAMKHLDPCGEFEVNNDFMKVPDGAVVNSIVLELRQATQIRPPLVDVSTQVPLDGNMWTLTMIHLPAFRTPLIIIASLDNQTPTDQIMSMFFKSWNNLVDPETARYPTWSEFDTEARWFYSWVAFSALDNVAQPTVDGTATEISQYRICADAMDVQFNTPTLIDQGWSVCGQVNCDFSHESVTAKVDSEGNHLIPHTLNFTGSATGGVTWPTPFGTVSRPVITSGSTSVLTASFATTVTAPGGTSIAIASGDQLRMTVDLDATPSPGRLFLQRSTDAGATWTTMLSYTFSPTWAPFTSTLNWTASGEVESTRINRVKIVSLSDMGNLFQMTPQAYVCTLKQTMGMYVVKRMWEPVFGLTNASTFAPLRFVNAISNEIDVENPRNGKYDTIDVNYGIAYVQLSGISQAAQPIITLRRVVEIVPDAKSTYAPLITCGAPKDDAALVIIKEFARHHPHAYPLDYNEFGKLFDIIGGVLGQIPIIGDVVKPLQAVLQSILGGGRKPNVGGIKNVIQGLDGEAGELLSALLQKLGL